jgi:hypothetical protein
MKRFIFKYVYFILAGMFCCQSCYDDKGNYDYMEINGLTFSGLEKSYAIRAGEVISIKPVLEATHSGDEDDYSYEWVWVNAYYKEKRYNAYVWSRLKEWDNFAIGLPAGSYTFYYRVKDNKTGVTWLSDNFTITIADDISTGFFILSEAGDGGRLDFINYYRDTLDLRLDILSKIGTEIPSLTNPLGVVCCADYNSPYMGAGAVSGENYYLSAILTQNGAYRLHPSTLLYEDKYNITNNFLVEALLPSGFYVKNILYYTVTNHLLLMDNNNNLYFTNRQMRLFWTAGIYTNTTPAGHTMNISPKVVFSDGGAIMYDTDSLSFAKQTAISTTTSNYFSNASEKIFEYDSDSLLFKFNKTGKELVYLHCRSRLDGISGNPVYTILKDPLTQEHFLGCFTHSGVQQYYRKLKNLPELSGAKDFSMTYNAGNQNYANEFLYYRTDDKIYAYSILDNTCKVVYPLATEQAGTSISFFGFVKMGNWRDYLLVCTYDPGKPGDSCGKMQVMKVAPVYGTLSVAEHNGEKMEWDGFAKIIDVAWKSK